MCAFFLTTNFLQNYKRVIFKVWQSVNGSFKDPLRDIILGFAAVDLTVLLFGMPWVSGWFNIMDFAGQCSGEIKVCIHILAANQIVCLTCYYL
jgi:C2 domain-containing protein 3